MRLWSLHPRYLDAKGLVALWREALLAQAVLRGRTKGYRHHPQLERFKAADRPVGAVAGYLREVFREAARRGYAFDEGRIASAKPLGRIDVTRGQLAYEWGYLMRKLAARDPARKALHSRVRRPAPHPILRVVPGPVAAWEKT